MTHLTNWRISFAARSISARADGETPTPADYAARYPVVAANLGLFAADTEQSIPADGTIVAGGFGPRPNNPLDAANDEVYETFAPVRSPASKL
ncbi:MAG: hypothetical protein QM811_19585 [Pirellulales bacterium]